MSDLHKYVTYIDPKSIDFELQELSYNNICGYKRVNKYNMFDIVTKDNMSLAKNGEGEYFYISWDTPIDIVEEVFGSIEDAVDFFGDKITEFPGGEKIMPL